MQYLHYETQKTAKFHPIWFNVLEELGIILESQTFPRPSSYLKTAYLFKVHEENKRKKSLKANGGT
jgi:hypothetical protein